MPSSLHPRNVSLPSTNHRPSPHSIFYSFLSIRICLSLRFTTSISGEPIPSRFHDPPSPTASSSSSSYSSFFSSISLRRSSNSRSLPAAFQSRDAFIVSADRETASRDNCEILIITRKQGALGVAQLGHLRSQITSRHRYAPFVRSIESGRTEWKRKDDPPILSISFMLLYAALNNIVMRNSSRWDGVNAAALISWSIFGRFDRWGS